MTCVSVSITRLSGYFIVICLTEIDKCDLVGELELGMDDIVRLALDSID